MGASRITPGDVLVGRCARRTADGGSCHHAAVDGALHLAFDPSSFPLEPGANLSLTMWCSLPGAASPRVRRTPQ